MAKKVVEKPVKITRKKQEISEDSEVSSDGEADIESSDNENINDSDNDSMDLDEGSTEKQDKAKKGSAQAFSEAMTNILGSALTGGDRKQPILARSKGVERKIEDEKLEYKAKKMLSAEKKKIKNQGRIIPDYTTFEYEKRLRKVATRGVVKLFNAIRTQQKVTEVAVQEATATRGTQLAKEKAKNVSTMSKSSFLDLLKSGNVKA
ncbi:Rrp15p-domain-containing protein [Cunninghamella echinulata]|nr:Rrp15p-domain-containing protein [Cunninghamella echinulata]